VYYPQKPALQEFSHSLLLRQLKRAVANTRRWLKKAQVLEDGALYQDAAFMRCDLNHTATCC
jgi:hypothetical protein